MKPVPPQSSVVIASIVALCLYLIAVYGFRERSVHPAHEMMERAVLQTGEWFDLVRDLKREPGVLSNPHNGTPYGWLLGDELTEITTTLGSLEAKRIASNPLFSALFVRYLWEAGIDSMHTVGVSISGSFPSLAIAALSAVQTIGARTIITSSLGASSFGANQEGATWIDIETYLVRNGGLRARTSLLTLGAEGDAGGGLSEAGISILKDAITRNEMEFYVPSSLPEAIQRKEDFFRQQGIDILINIGGSQTSLGGCPHGPTLPNGFHEFLPPCMHENRGVIMRMAETGIPIVHILNIRDLSLEENIAAPDNDENDLQFAGKFYTYPKTPIALLLICTFVSIFVLYRSRVKTNRKTSEW